MKKQIILLPFFLNFLICYSQTNDKDYFDVPFRAKIYSKDSLKIFVSAYKEEGSLFKISIIKSSYQSSDFFTLKTLDNQEYFLKFQYHGEGDIDSVFYLEEFIEIEKKHLNKISKAGIKEISIFFFEGRNNKGKDLYSILSIPIEDPKFLKNIIKNTAQ